MLKCESLKFRLQAPIDGDKELLCQVEPYYTYLALYDARSGRKLTENFHFDLNHAAVKDLVKDAECTKSLVENFSYDVKLDVKQIPEDWFKSKKQVCEFMSKMSEYMSIVKNIVIELTFHFNLRQTM